MKDLESFLVEGEKDKKKSKSESPKAKEAKEGEGADDRKYVRLMEKYKRERRKGSDEASKILKQAMKLGKTGDVSHNAKIAGAYI